MPQTIRLAELASGAALLDVDDGGHPKRPLVLVDLDGADWSLAGQAVAALRDRSVVTVGLASAPLPDSSAPLLEALTTTLAPAGPGRSWVARGPGGLDKIARTVAAAPLACVTMAGLLEVTSRSSVPDGLVVESLAYSLLLAGPEFLAWRTQTPRGAVPVDDAPVLLSRSDNRLSIVLNRPSRHNAFGRAVRDGLLDGLRLAAADPGIEQVEVSGNGPSFCSGGDLDEFGTATDVAAAHMVRLQQSAGYAVHQIAGRVRVNVHGACIGAGIEVPAFASRIEAKDGTWFMLPELAFGLVPGAGGTVSITHRIGRWRTAYMALTGARVDLETALAWGLVDALV